MKPVMRTQTVIDIVTMGLLSAILLLGQVGMAFLPSIEPVTLLIILYTLVYNHHLQPLHHLCPAPYQQGTVCDSVYTRRW